MIQREKQGKTEYRWCGKIREMIHDIDEKFSKDTEVTKIQSEVMEQKHSINEIKIPDESCR